ncbi:hypothetical protein ACHAPX_006279 [Trichoderma viride]
MLPDLADVDGGGFQEGELLAKARDEYGVKLVPIQTQYERVIAIDSDTTLLKYMDESFYLPPSPMAMPRTYWLLGNDTAKETLASHFPVIQPEKYESSRI